VCWLAREREVHLTVTGQVKGAAARQNDENKGSKRLNKTKSNHNEHYNQFKFYCDILLCKPIFIL
jgi:hypothetical protein